MVNTVKHKEYTLKGRRVILDASELAPGSYETMLMTSGGYVEIASIAKCRRASSSVAALMLAIST